MKIKQKATLFLTVDFPPRGGGMARHSLDVVSALGSIGIKTIVIAPGTAKETAAVTDAPVYRIKHITDEHIFDNYVWSVCSFLFLAMKCCVGYDVNLIVANTWSVAGVAAFFIKKVTGKPYVVFAHGLDVYAPQAHPKIRRLMEIVLENASIVIANSAFTKRLVEEATNRARVTVLNPMVNSARLVSGAGPGGGDDRGRRKAILTVARLVESKGHDLVIRSLPKVLSRFPDTIYRIVGSGPGEAALRSLAAELGVSNHVIFAGEVDEGDLVAYYRGCDVFVMASRQIPHRGEVEGFGIVFLEAGVFGKPVIGSRSGGIPDAVKDGVTGILVDLADPETITDAIIRLFSDNDLARRLGEGGKKRVEEEFSAAMFSRQLKEVIEMVGVR